MSWARLESCLGQGLGACNTMGTASTMAIMAETLGLALPGSAVLAAGDPRQEVLAEAAGRRGLSLPLREFGEISAGVPVIADVAPIGTGLMSDLAAAGGVPAVLAAIADDLDLSVPTAAGASLGESLVNAPVRWPIGDPVTSQPGFMVVYGNLAPDGAVIKAAAASPALLRHRGPAVVFDSYEEMRARIDDRRWT